MVCTSSSTNTKSLGMFSMPQINAPAIIDTKLSFPEKGRYSDAVKSNSGKLCFIASQSVLTNVKISSSPLSESQAEFATEFAICDKRVVLP
jgi:hypothetical protein